MRIRFLASLLAFLMLFGVASMLFTACGEEESTETPESTTTNAPTTTTTPVTTEPEEPQVDPISQDGLMLWYDFKNGEAKDVSGNNQNGQVYGTMESVTGVWNDAMFFSGGYVDLPDIDFTSIQAFTVSLWVCPLRSTNNSRVWVFSPSNKTSFAILLPRVKAVTTKRW